MIVVPLHLRHRRDLNIHDRLHQRIVIRVTDTADRRGDALQGQILGELHRGVLAVRVRMMGQFPDGKVPTIAEVAAEVGLARSSVYLYVASGKDMIIQLLLQSIPAWLDSLTAELDRVGPDPAERLAAYVRVTLTLFVEGSHGPLMSAASTLPEAFADERVQESHNGLDPALRELLGDEVESVRPLIDAMIHRGAELINQNQAEFDQIAGILQRMARAAVNPPRGARP